MVIWLAETPCGALKASQNPLWIYLIILIMNFLSYFYKSYGLICHHSNGFWLAKTPRCAIKDSKNPLSIYAIVLIIIFHKIVFLYIIIVMGFWLAETPCGAIKASQNSLWIYAIILIMNFFSYFYKNSLLIYNCSNGVLISRDPLRGHQSFTKSIMNSYNYFDNEFSLIFV